MSTHTVVTPFNTPTRRFTAGQPVTEADITGPLSLAERVALGQIEAPAPRPAKKAAKPAPTEPETPAT